MINCTFHWGFIPMVISGFNPLFWMCTVSPLPMDPRCNASKATFKSSRKRRCCKSCACCSRNLTDRIWWLDLQRRQVIEHKYEYSTCNYMHIKAEKKKDTFLNGISSSGGTCSGSIAVLGVSRIGFKGSFNWLSLSLSFLKILSLRWGTPKKI